jgi:hypothetical protein
VAQWRVTKSKSENENKGENKNESENKSESEREGIPVVAGPTKVHISKVPFIPYDLYYLL